MNCKVCGAALKQLFSSCYCPNDCDRPKPVAALTPVEPKNVWLSLLEEAREQGQRAKLDLSKLKKDTDGPTYAPTQVSLRTSGVNRHSGWTETDEKRIPGTQWVSFVYHDGKWRGV